MPQSVPLFDLLVFLLINMHSWEALRLPFVYANRLDDPVQDGELPHINIQPAPVVVKCRSHNCSITTDDRTTFVVCSECRSRVYCSLGCAKNDEVWHTKFCSHHITMLAQSLYSENRTILGAIAIKHLIVPDFQYEDVSDYMRQASKVATRVQVELVLLEDQQQYPVLFLNLEQISAVSIDELDAALASKVKRSDTPILGVTIDCQHGIWGGFGRGVEIQESFQMDQSSGGSQLCDTSLGAVNSFGMNLLKLAVPSKVVRDYIASDLWIPLQCTQDPFYAITFLRKSDDEVAIVYSFDSAIDRPLVALPYEIEQDKHCRPIYLNLGNARYPNYFYNGQPYLPFVPVNDIFEGPIFHRFNGTRGTFEDLITLQQNGQYMFDSDIAVSWIRVEQVIMKLCRAFYRPLVKLDTPPFPYPSQTKFHHPKGKISQVLDAIFFARKLIVFLVAELRYSIACSDHVKDEPWTSVWPRLEGVGHFDVTWMGNLARSKAMTSKTLAGCVVESAELERPYRFHRFAYYNVPIHLIIGHVCIDSEVGPLVKLDAISCNAGLPLEMEPLLEVVQERWNCIMPDFLQICRAKGSASTPELPDRPPSPDWAIPTYSPHPNDFLLSPESPPSSPKPDPNPFLPAGLPADQREWWYDHRRDVELMEECGDGPEKDIDAELRLERILKAAQANLLAEHLLDGYEAIWYFWEPTPLHPQFLVRRKMHRSEVKRIWPYISDSHRIYNSYRNEWDLYHPSCDFVTLTRDLTTRHKIDSVNDMDLLDIIEGAFGLSETSEEVDFALDASTLLHVENRCNRLESPTVQQSALDHAKRRFGFLPSDSCDQEEQKSWWYWLGIGSGVHDASLGALVHALLNRNTRRLELMLDIYVRRRQFTDIDTFVIRRCPNAILSTTTSKTCNLYLLYFSLSEDIEWVLAVPNAADVVLALRMGWADTRENLVRQYLEIGVVFFTLVPRLSPSDPSLCVQIESLVPSLVAPRSRKHHLSDFYDYQTRREEFLDSPLGRCMGKTGGISGRLWRKDSTKFESRLKNVLSGPTAIAKWIGVQVECGNDLFYDDFMSPMMDAFVSGQYQMPYGDPTVVTLNKLTSWYPTNAVFNCRYNFENAIWNSRWSIYHEEMFNQWEKDIFQTATPTTSSEWKRGFGPRPAQLDAAYEEYCIAFLESYMATYSESALHLGFLCIPLFQDNSLGHRIDHSIAFRLNMSSLSSFYYFILLPNIDLSPLFKVGQPLERRHEKIIKDMDSDTYAFKFGYFGAVAGQLYDCILSNFFC
ncbi:hypothetical protein CPB83DRAFT_840878 [Crepidotus variabilis]|uniref:MYND-type domain-containing protein n=1 Tax=Crepidotus variabilis TaxID=179855 RepID=A0A9P6E3M1_9AGAR|nr:hypothetical protein CPB83DRAFT_840878 [Crepidotus variabilis]